MEINRFEAYEFTSDGSYMLCDMWSHIVMFSYMGGEIDSRFI